MNRKTKKPVLHASAGIQSSRLGYEAHKSDVPCRRSSLDSMYFSPILYSWSLLSYHRYPSVFLSLATTVFTPWSKYGVRENDNNRRRRKTQISVGMLLSAQIR